MVPVLVVREEAIEGMASTEGVRVVVALVASMGAWVAAVAEKVVT